jgi:TP53 regulating kinase-like protein
LKAGICVPKVVFVDEKSGVLALERVEGWSVREILGGGAEGEVEDDGEGDYVEPNEAKAVVEELEGVKSEGLEALERIGVTKRESAIVTKSSRVRASAQCDFLCFRLMTGSVNEGEESFS